MDKQPRDAQVGRAGRQAGAMLLVMAVLAGFGYGVAVTGLVTEGNPTRTAQELIASRGLFTAGLICLAGVLVLDVLVAWKLYIFFWPVNRTVAMVGAALRVLYAAIFALTLSQLVAVLVLVNSDTAALSTDGPGDVLAGLDRFRTIWDVGLIAFGIHLLVLAWLIARSGYVPTLVGVLLAAAGVGYLVDSVGAWTTSGQWTRIATFTFIGELVFAFWLLIRAGHVQASERHRDGATPTRDATARGAVNAG